MEGRGKQVAAPGRPIVYCVLPRSLADKLHEPLRRHFREDQSIEIVVERRTSERRLSIGRRAPESNAPAPEDRRRIRNASGRRIAERRVPVLAADTPELPRIARRHAPQLVFVERFEPVRQDAEDTDTARLITKIQAGDNATFADLYMRYFDRVYSYLRVVFNNAHDAEEGVQQVFVSVLEALPNYEHRRVPFRGWLFVIARNYAIGELRKRNRLEPTDPIDLDRDRANHTNALAEPEHQGSLDWITDRELMLFIERLPLPQKQVLVLRYVLDLSHGQIATILGRSPDDVRALLSRAQRFLRARLTAVGRDAPASARGRAPMTRRPAHAYLLRRRRFALMR